MEIVLWNQIGTKIYKTELFITWQESTYKPDLVLLYSNYNRTKGRFGMPLKLQIRVKDESLWRHVCNINVYLKKWIILTSKFGTCKTVIRTLSLLSSSSSFSVHQHTFKYSQIKMDKSDDWHTKKKCTKKFPLTTHPLTFLGRFEEKMTKSLSLTVHFAVRHCFVLFYDVFQLVWFIFVIYTHTHKEKRSYHSSFNFDYIFLSVSRLFLCSSLFFCCILECLYHSSTDEI